jgi:hypothetical protein
MVGCLALAVAGCGGGEGVEEGATVSVYAAAPLCAGAKNELARERDRAGSVGVRLRCLPKTDRDGRLDLAAIGANARRATEDSTTVGYIGETSPAATRFSSSILESAGIAQVSGMSGRAALAELLGAIDAAGDAGNLREAVYEDLTGRS